MNNNKIEKFIFIVGSPRSGTTLLQRLIGNLEGSFTMPETHIFNILAENFYYAIRSNNPIQNLKYQSIISFKTYTRVVSFLKIHANFTLSQDIKKKLENKIKKKKLKLEFFINTIFNEYNDLSEKICIEKTPSHIYCVDTIKATIKNHLIIAIIRDPRDAFLSFNKMLIRQSKKPRSIYEFSTIWNSTILEIEKHNLYYLKYENLIDEPIVTINSLLEIKGLKINSIDKIPKNLSIEREVWKKNAYENIIKDNINKFKKELSLKEIQEFNYYCLDNLQKFNYETFDSTLPSFTYRLFYKFLKIKYRLTLFKELSKSIFNFIVKRYV